MKSSQWNRDEWQDKVEEKDDEVQNWKRRMEEIGEEVEKKYSMYNSSLFYIFPLQTQLSIQIHIFICPPKSTKY